MPVNPVQASRDEVNEPIAAKDTALTPAPKLEKPQNKVIEPAANLDSAHAAIKSAHDKLAKGLLSTGAVLDCLAQAAAKPAKRVVPPTASTWSPMDLSDEDIAERIEFGVAALEDPRSQPQPDYESMLYVRNASNYVYRLVDKPLWGPTGTIRPDVVHMNFTAEGDLAAAMQSVLAAFPRTAQQLIVPVPNSDLYRVNLHMPSTRGAGQFTPVTFAIDGHVLASPGGRLLGDGQSIGPLLLAKGVMKLHNVVSQLMDRPLTWPLIVEMLTGVSAQEHMDVDTNTLSRCIDAWQRGAAGYIAFCDALDMTQNEFANGTLEAVLGSLGLRVQSKPHALDAVLLSQHKYTVLGFNDATKPTHIVLSNPLGFNPDLRGGEIRRHEGKFVLPEEVTDLPHGPATFAFPLTWLHRLVRNVGVAGPEGPGLAAPAA